jgi:hypothetical protein
VCMKSPQRLWLLLNADDRSLHVDTENECGKSEIREN